MDREDPTLIDSTDSGVSVKTVNLALQGGGAHGAFTWGVLDRLIEDERVAIDGISATSAGAMNGAALIYGLADWRPGRRARTPAPVLAPRRRVRAAAA